MLSKNKIFTFSTNHDMYFRVVVYLSTFGSRKVRRSVEDKASEITPLAQGGLSGRAKKSELAPKLDVTESACFDAVTRKAIN